MFSAIAPASTAKGRSPRAAAGSSRMRGGRGPGTRRVLPHSGRVNFRHSRESSDLGSITSGCGIGVLAVVEVEREQGGALSRCPGRRSAARRTCGRRGRSRPARSRPAAPGRGPPERIGFSTGGSRPWRLGGFSGAGGPPDVWWGGDPRERCAADGDALHPRGRQLEQVGDLGGGDQGAHGWDERPEREREPPAVQALADDHHSAVKAVLPAAGLDGGRDRLARLRAVGGDDGFEPEQAAVLGASGVLHL